MSARSCVCRDDVGDHERWAKHFNAQRILHADEVVPDTQAVELKLTGAAAGPEAAPAAHTQHSAAQLGAP